MIKPPKWRRPSEDSSADDELLKLERDQAQINRRLYWLQLGGLLGGILSLCVAIIATWVSMRALDRSTEAAIGELRAYVGISDASMTAVRWSDQRNSDLVGAPKNSMVWAATSKYKNTGATPAHDVVMHSRLWIGAFPKRGSPPLPQTRGGDEPDPSKIVLWPDDESGTVARLEFPPTKNDMENFRQYRSALYYTGVIDYRDSFGLQRSTRFCYYWSPYIYGNKTGMAQCAVGNSAN